MKGISPVIATVLMVAVAIAAAVVAYSWIMSMQSGVQTETAQQVQGVGAEKVVIEAFECNNDNNTLTFYMRNIGTTDVSGTLTVNIKDSTGQILCSTTVSMGSALSSGSVSGYTVQLSNCPAAYDTCTELGNADPIVVEVKTPGGFTAASTPEEIS